MCPWFWRAAFLDDACYRGVKDQYLAVRSKADYWSVPVTEEVPETHLCSDYQRRVPGTGYRG